MIGLGSNSRLITSDAESEVSMGNLDSDEEVMQDLNFAFIKRDDIVESPIEFPDSAFVWGCPIVRTNGVRDLVTAPSSEPTIVSSFARKDSFKERSGKFLDESPFMQNPDSAVITKSKQISIQEYTPETMCTHRRFSVTSETLLPPAALSSTNATPCMLPCVAAGDCTPPMLSGYSSASQVTTTIGSGSQHPTPYSMSPQQRDIGGELYSHPMSQCKEAVMVQNNNLMDQHSQHMQQHSSHIHQQQQQTQQHQHIYSSMQHQGSQSTSLSHCARSSSLQSYNQPIFSNEFLPNPYPSSNLTPQFGSQMGSQMSSHYYGSNKQVKHRTQPLSGPLPGFVPPPAHGSSYFQHQQHMQHHAPHMQSIHANHGAIQLSPYMTSSPQPHSRNSNLLQQHHAVHASAGAAFGATSVFPSHPHMHQGIMQQQNLGSHHQNLTLFPGSGMSSSPAHPGKRVERPSLERSPVGVRTSQSRPSKSISSARSSFSTAPAAGLSTNPSKGGRSMRQSLVADCSRDLMLLHLQAYPGMETVSHDDAVRSVFFPPSFATAAYALVQQTQRFSVSSPARDSAVFNASSAANPSPLLGPADEAGISSTVTAAKHTQMTNNTITINTSDIKDSFAVPSPLDFTSQRTTPNTTVPAASNFDFQIASNSHSTPGDSSIAAGLPREGQNSQPQETDDHDFSRHAAIDTPSNANCAFLDDPASHLDGLRSANVELDDSLMARSENALLGSGRQISGFDTRERECQSEGTNTPMGFGKLDGLHELQF